MRRYGMGWMGGAIIRHARLSAIMVVALTLTAAAILSGGLGYNGDLTALMKVDTPSWRLLENIEKDFQPFSADEVLVVEAPDLGKAEILDALADFVVELQLVDGVASVLSVFSLPAGGDSGTTSFLTSDKALELHGVDRLNHLLSTQPIARDLLSQDRSMTLILVMPVISEDGEARLPATSLKEIADLAADQSTFFSVGFAGLGAINRSIAASLQSDLVLLSTLATSMCVIMALVVFRSWRGAVICAIAPITGVVWFFAFSNLAGIPIDPVTVIIPVLLIVVGFADAVHLHFAWLKARRDGLDKPGSLKEAFSRVAPACFLTSVTTAIACLGTGLSGSVALNAFAWAGFTGMFIQFFAVMMIVPLLTMWMGERSDRSAAFPFSFAGLTRLAIRFTSRPAMVTLVTSILFITLLVAQFQLENGYRVSEHLDPDGALRKLETRIASKGLGSGQVLIRILNADDKPGLGEADMKRITSVLRAVRSENDAQNLARLFMRADEAGSLSEDDQPVLRRFVSRDNEDYLLALPIDVSASSGDISGKGQEIEAKLRKAGLGDVTVVAGFPLISANEVPVMISDLRVGFLVAVGLVMIVLAHATRSIKLGLISLAPSLTPIFGVEAWLWLTGQQLTMTAAVALTIAFGIAVDDTIHVLNRFRQADRTKKSMDVALRETTPPIAASTILLVVGLAVTQISSLPSAVIFGELVSAALILALFASLFMLPSHILTLFVDRKET